MSFRFLRAALRLWLAAAIITTAQVAHAQPADEAPEEDQPAELDADGMDPLAATLTPKQRSEYILYKTFTDAQWQGFVSDLAADRAACERGDLQACVDAGDAYATGEGVWLVPAIAEILYQQACDGKLGAGCSAMVRLGDDTFLDWPVDRRSYLRKACDFGDLDGCASYAALLAESGDPADAEQAEALVARACEAGGGDACDMRAQALEGSEQPAERLKAAELREFACEHGSLGACESLLAALEGSDKPDQTRLALLMDRICDLGDEQRCSELAMHAWDGKGIAPDPERAIRYAERACAMHSRFCSGPASMREVLRARAPCDAGDMAACAALGTALADRFSPALDQDAATALLEKACRAGLVQACNDIAIAAGLFITTERQMELLRFGCQSGGREACFRLGVKLAGNGWDDRSDPDAAAALFIPLCDTGYPGACAAESELVGVAAAARVLPADMNALPPLMQGPQAAKDLPEICFTASERFRGKLYSQENCSRAEKGIGSARARPGAAPWQALIWRPAKFGNLAPAGLERVHCGGSLIAQGWILTAAHCLKDNGFDIAKAGHQVRLGVFNPLGNEGVSYPILKVIPHPNFGKLAPNQFGFDIALVQYDAAKGRVGRDGIPSTRRRPIAAIALDPIPVERRKIVAGTPVYVFGWGVRSEQDGSATDYLQILKIELASQAVCDATTGFKGALGGSAVCAGRKGRQACYGDSGGPLVSYPLGGAPPVLLGVVSAGLKCGETDRVSQYTRVAKVRAWIAQNVPGVR